MCLPSASQTVVGGGLQAISHTHTHKSIAKIVSDTERMKNTPIHVCTKLPLLVDHQQEVGELVLSVTTCP
jgi:hypothetical protein